MSALREISGASSGGDHGLAVKPHLSQSSLLLPRHLISRILHLEAVGWAAGAVRQALSLRHDAFEAGRCPVRASMPLLNWYADILKAAIGAGDVRLMIVGYGFADEHINAAIADAVELHGLSVFIWNTASDLKSLVLGSPHGARIWKGLISTATRRLTEVFPSNQAETEEYRRICSTFFA